MSLTLSPRGFAAIQAFEGFAALSIPLRDGRFVIGYGHVEQAARPTALTPDEAEALLRADLAAIEAGVRAALMVHVTQSQFDAVVSFAHSIGLEAFEGSDVLAALNAGDTLAAGDALGRWRASAARGPAVALDPLIRRRAAEQAMFLAQDPMIGVASAALRPILPVDATQPVAAVKRDPVATEKLRAILGASPHTAVALAPPPADDEEALDPAAPVPLTSPSQPTEGDTIGLTGLAAFGLILLAVGLAALLGGGANGAFAFLLFAAPGAMAMIIALYYLARAKP